MLHIWSFTNIHLVDLVLFYIAAVYKRDIYYSFLMVDRNMFGTKSSSKCNCILSRRITFPWINMLNKMKICKWIIVAVAENGMREVYHCKLFAWFSLALNLNIKQRNSWYEHCILLPIIILWGLNMLTLQWQSNQGVPKQMQIQSQVLISYSWFKSSF